MHLGAVGEGEGAALQEGHQRCQDLGGRHIDVLHHYPPPLRHRLHPSSSSSCFCFCLQTGDVPMAHQSATLKCA